MTRAHARRAVPLPFARGSRLLQRMYTRLGCHGRPPQFVAEFYPYAGLVQTIRLRDDVAYVRFSDLLRTAPLEIQEAAAAILLSRIFRRRLPKDLRRTYQDYYLSAVTRRRLDRVRSQRSRRVRRGPQGDAYDLAPMFDRLNSKYFGGALSTPHIGWSDRPWRSQLGCYDAALNQIVLSCHLDRPRVPRYVVEYVVYHEMLHIKFPLRRAACGLQAHSAAFRAEERKYRHYARAMRYLKRF